MPQLQPMILRFRQAQAADVQGNRIYLLPDGTPFDYDQPHEDIAPPTPSADGYSRVDLAALPSAASLDGVYDVFVTAIDERGNESDPLEIPDANFDFSAPDAPTDGAIEDA